MTDEQILEIASEFSEWTEQGYAVVDKLSFARALLADRSDGEFKQIYQEGYHDGYSEGYAAGLAITSGKQEADDDIEECREILTDLISNIEKDGMYSKEATLTFLNQALLCLTESDWPDAASDKQEAAMVRAGISCLQRYAFRPNTRINSLDKDSEGSWLRYSDVVRIVEDAIRKDSK